KGVAVTDPVPDHLRPARLQHSLRDLVDRALNTPTGNAADHLTSVRDRHRRPDRPRRRAPGPDHSSHREPGTRPVPRQNVLEDVTHGGLWAWIGSSSSDAPWSCEDVALSAVGAESQSPPLSIHQATPGHADGIDPEVPPPQAPF